jgi:hypothetical protein
MGFFPDLAGQQTQPSTGGQIEFSHRHRHGRFGFAGKLIFGTMLAFPRNYLVDFEIFLRQSPFLLRIA